MTGLELKARREALGLTQMELAYKLGVGQNTLSRWENERFSPLPAYEAKLHAVLARMERAQNRPKKGLIQ